MGILKKGELKRKSGCSMVQPLEIFGGDERNRTAE